MRCSNNEDDQNKVFLLVTKGEEELRIKKIQMKKRINFKTIEYNDVYLKI